MRYIQNISEKKIRENHAVFQERYNVYKDNGLDFLRSRDFILKKAGSFKEKILDVGSGRGITVLALARAGYDVTTVDTNQEMLEITCLNLAFRNLLSKVESYQMDAYSLEFNDRSFNTVFMVEALHHMDNVKKLMEELDRVLAKKGKMVLADFNQIGKDIIEKVHSSEGRRHEGSFSGKKEAEKWLLENGYKYKEYDDICHWVIIAEKGDKDG